jgi:hypothetical protein
MISSIIKIHPTDYNATPLVANMGTNPTLKLDLYGPNPNKLTKVSKSYVSQ